MIPSGVTAVLAIMTLIIGIAVFVHAIRELMSINRQTQRAREISNFRQFAIQNLPEKRLDLADISSFQIVEIAEVVAEAVLERHQKEETGAGA